MATLKVNIDSSGAEDGARKLESLIAKIAQQTAEVTKSYQVWGTTAGQAFSNIEASAEAYAEAAKGAYAGIIQSQSLYLAKLKLEEEYLRKNLSAEALLNAEMRAKPLSSGKLAALESVASANASLIEQKRIQTEIREQELAQIAAEKEKESLYQHQQLILRNIAESEQKMATDDVLHNLKQRLAVIEQTRAAALATRQAILASGIPSGASGISQVNTKLTTGPATSGQIAGLGAIFNANYSSGIEPVRNLKKELEGLGEAAGKTGNSFLGFNTASLSTWTSLTVGLTALYAIRRGFTEGITTITEYEKQLSILKAVTGATEKEQKDLASAARTAGAGGNFSAKENAAGLVDLAKAGFSANESIAALNGVVAFAVNAQISISQAADTSAKIIRQFNLDAGDAVRVIDALTTVANKTTTDVENLANAFKYVGPAANSLHTDIETTAAALGILAQRGIEASLAGTNLRRILLELESPTPEATKLFQGMGIALEKVKPSANSLVSILKTLRDANLSVTQARVLFDQRSAVGATVLADYADEVEKLIEKQKEEQGVALRNAAIINDNLSGAWNRLGNTIKEVTLETGFAAGAMRFAVDNVNAGLLLLSGNWRNIRAPGDDEALYKLRDLADSMKDVGKDTSGLEKFKLGLEGLISSLKAAKPETSFNLASLVKLDQVGDSAAADLSKKIAQYYKDSLEAAKADFYKTNESFRFFDINYWEQHSGITIDASRASMLRDQAVYSVEQVLEDVKKKLEASKPVEIKKPFRFDPSLFEDIKDKGLAGQADSLDRAIEAAKEQRAALEDGTIYLRAQNKVRAEENSLVAEQVKLFKELDRAEKLIQDGSQADTADKKKLINDAKLEIEASLKDNAARREKLDILRRELVLLGAKQDILEKTKRFESEYLNNSINQSARTEDLKAESDSYKVASQYREEYVQVIREQVAAQREYQELVKHISVYDTPENIYKFYERAGKARDDRIKANTELIQQIEMQKRIDELAKGLASSMSMAAENILIDTKNIGKYIQEMVRDIQRQLLHELFTKPLENALSGMFQTLLGNLGFGGAPSFIGPPSGQGSGPGSGHAYGDAFGPQGDIIHMLSSMPMGSRRDRVGEKGAEGILPLGRDAQGRLGVHVMGSTPSQSNSNQSTTINRIANVTVFARDADSFRKTSKQISADMRKGM